MSAQFFKAQRAWTRQVRSMSRLSWQQGRVAWALAELFSTKHGVAYPAFDTIGERAGGIDRRDVSRAIAALLALRCIEEVSHADVASAAASDGVDQIGSRLRGFRMVLDQSVSVTDDVADLVSMATLATTQTRIRRQRTKGGTLLPLVDDGPSGAEQGSIGGKTGVHRGHSAPQIDRLIEEDARLARASLSPSVLVDGSVSIDTKTDDVAGRLGAASHPELVEYLDVFTDLEVNRDGFKALIVMIGIDEVANRLHLNWYTREPMTSLSAWLNQQPEMDLSDMPEEDDAIGA